MLVQPIAGMLLIVNVATGPAIEPESPASHLSPQQKSAAMQPLVHSATECITRAVGADPRLGKAPGLGDLIVEAVPTCLTQVRAMIDGFDRYFGEGSGETFFMGPYLDALPTAVSKAVGQPVP
jgi:hypothetical protein